MSVIASITARLLLGSKRSLWIGLVMVLPIVIAIVFRATGEEANTVPASFAQDLVSGLVLSLLLPFVALMMGTTAIGSEIEDGTVVFLLSKPVKRARVFLVKAAVAAAATAAIAVPATVATSWIVVGSPGTEGLVVGLGLAALVASVLYSAIFVTLSTVTSRALVIGLIYVFVWESILGDLFAGLAWVSVRQQALGWSGAAIELERYVSNSLPVTGAVVASLVSLGLALVVGANKLAAFEIGERA